MSRQLLAWSCLCFLLQALHAFDRSAVENEIRFPYYEPATVQQYYRGDVESRPQQQQFIAKTKFGTYYGAAANPWFLSLLPKKNKDVFPMSKAEVQSKPRGISVYDARRALLQTVPRVKDAEGAKIVCYFEGWAVYRKAPMGFTVQDIDPQMCTHLIYSFAGLEGNSIVSLDPEIDIEKGGYRQALALKERNPKLKVMIAIGGWSEGVVKYSKMASSLQNRREFVESVVDFVQTHGFDGLDVDWEYPGDTERGGSWSDMDNYSLLLEELRAAFNPRGWLLSAAVPAPKSRVDSGYDVKRIAQVLDFINVMTYDLHGSWDGFADHHAPLYKREHDYYPFNTLTVDYAMQYWHQKGAPKDKLIMGVPFYGRSFVLQNANNFKPGQSAKSKGEGFAGEFTDSKGYVAYFEICSLEKKEQGWNSKVDDTGNVFMHKDDLWVGFDTAETIKRKMNYVRANGFGGGMIWAIDLDDFRGECGEAWPLLKMMNSVLFSEDPIPIEEVTEIAAPAPPIESSSTSTFQCPGAGTFASDTDCQTYFQCTSDGKAYANQCPQGLHFNPISKICDWPDNVNCQLKENQLLQKDVCAVQLNGLYSDPRHCHQMYWCINGRKVQTSCPSGLFFDPMSASCHFYAAYSCHGNANMPSTLYHQFPVAPLHRNVLPKPVSDSYRKTDITNYFYKAKNTNIICYFANWANLRQEPANYVPENMNAKLCTHIFYAYASLDSASFEVVPGQPMVDINEGYYNRVQSLARAQNPKVKILLAVGGWTDSSGDKYSRLVNDPKKRMNFVKKTVKMLKTRKFDGLSLEWHYPVCWHSNCAQGNPKDKQGFSQLVKDLKKAFKRNNLILAAGLSGYPDVAREAYDIPILSQNLDLANIYAYDYHGFWNGKTGHHSPLQGQEYAVESSLQFYTKNGFAKRKLHLGIPFYGHSYTLSSARDDNIGSRSVGPGAPGEFSKQQGMLTYFEICNKVKQDNWIKSYSAKKGAYATKGNQWVSYNDINFVDEKASYVLSSGLGGVAVFTMDMDDFNNNCCYGENPLLVSLKAALHKSGKISPGNCQKPAAVTTPAPPEISTGYDDGGKVSSTANPWEWEPAESTTKSTTTKRTTTKRTTTVAPPSNNDVDLEQGKPCPSVGETFSHKDCQKYYRCVNGKLLVQTCTVGLLWNNDSKRCDWANLIWCGRRTIPQGMQTRDSNGEQDQQPPVTTTSKTTTTTSNSIACNPGSYSAVPGECGAYISCNTNGQSQKSYCSQGLHWNQKTLSCNWASESDCQDNPDVPNVYEKFYREGQPCSQEGSFAPNPSDCGSFLMCNHEKYIVRPCGGGLHWDDKIKACNSPDKAGCGEESSGESSGSISTASPPVIVTENTPTSSTTQWQWTPSNDNNDGQYNPGQWEWTTTTTETTFVETSNVQQPLSGDYKVVCYFTNWAWYRPGIGKYQPQDIDPTICTHVVYGFAVLDGSRLLIKPHDTWADLDNHFYKKVTALKKYGIKVTIAIGGWNDSLGSKYSKLVNNPAARAKFVKHVVEFIEEHGFDGLDLDWEYPKCWQVDCDKGPESDKEAFALWVKELKEAFRPKGLLLSAAVSPSKKVMDLGYDIPSIARDLDWIAVMTYDYHGHWDKKTGHVSPMYAHPEDDYDYFNTDFTMKYWMENGAPANKLVMGMPLYGQAFTLNSDQNTGLNAPANQKGTAGEFTRAAGFLAYYEICDMIKNKGFNVVKDPEGRLGPYAFKDRQWVGYDDVAMIRYKSEYIRKMGFAGGMVWALDLDDFKNRCGQGHHPLMNTIKEVLGPKMNAEEQAARAGSRSSFNGDSVPELDIRKPDLETESNVMTPKVAVNEKKVVCYFTNWAFYRPGKGKFLPSDIDVTLCTHIIYGFAVLDRRTLQIRAHDSWVDFDKEFYKQVTALKSKGRKVSLALGGWNDSKGDKYSRLVNDPSARAKFIEYVIPFLKEHGFDGLDLDWEYPKCWQVDCKKGPESDKEAFANWVQELSEAFAGHGLILSSAMSPSAKVCDEAYDIPKLNKYFDFVSVMTYDYHGQWDKKTGHVAPLYQHPDDFDETFNVNYTVNYWLEKGMDKSKIIMGIPLYGQSFTLASAKNNGLNSKTYGGANAGRYTRSRGFLSYYEICDKVRNKGWKVVRDDKKTMGPYAHKGSQWVGFDDVDTIEQKMELLKQYDLGGAMIWALDLDDFNDQCGNGKYPLLKTINHGLGRLDDYERPQLLTNDETFVRGSELDEEEEEVVEELEKDIYNPQGIAAVPYNYFWNWPFTSHFYNWQTPGFNPK